MTKLKIGIALAWQNDGSVANFVGDAMVAEKWKKYLERRDDVANVAIIGPPYDYSTSDYHCIIHYQPWLPRCRSCRNIWYVQNAFTDFPIHGPQGPAKVDTLGMFELFKRTFDAFLFPSQGLKDACHDNPDSLVLPFACDHEEMRYEYDEKYAAPVVFVGNDIRGDETNERYLAPAIPHGLVIYGGPWGGKYAACHRGKVPQEDLHKVYSSAKVMLDVTHSEWKKHGLVNQRVYDILVCGGVVITDNPTVAAGFDGGVGLTPGGIHTKVGIEAVQAMCISDSERERRRDAVLSAHTYEHRVADLMAWLKELV